MSRIVHFEIPATVPNRSIKFYSDVFGWKFEKWEGPIEYWLVRTGEGPGIDGGLMRRMDPNQPMTSVIGVPSIDEWLPKIVAAGGEIAVPKTPIPGVGYFAYFKDLDGTILGLHEVDPSAK